MIDDVCASFGAVAVAAVVKTPFYKAPSSVRSINEFCSNNDDVLRMFEDKKQFQRDLISQIKCDKPYKILKLTYNIYKSDFIYI